MRMFQIRLYNFLDVHLGRIGFITVLVWLVPSRYMDSLFTSRTLTRAGQNILLCNHRCNIRSRDVCVCVIVSVLGRREVIQILKDVITDSLKDQGKEDSVHRMGLQFLFMVHQFLLAGVEPWVIMNNMLMHQAHSQTLVSPCLVKQGLALALYIFVTGL